MLDKLADMVEQHAEEFALLETLVCLMSFVDMP